MTLELLQLLQFVSYFIVATIFIVMIKADNKVIRVQIDGINKNIEVLNTSFTKLGEIMKITAVQDNRIKNIEDDIRELKHGKGFIRDGSRNSIDGEYK